MSRPIGTGLKVVRAKLADGSIREYYFDRKTGKALGSDRAVAETAIEARLAAEATLPSSAFTTLGELIDRYKRSGDFTERAPGTRTIYGQYLGQLREQFPNVPARGINKEWVELLKTSMQDTPAKCNQTLAVLRLVLRQVVPGLLPVNPVSLVRKAKETPRTMLWTPKQIETFLASAESPALRLAMALMIYTAQRVSDVLEMTIGRVSERDGRLFIALRQNKTSELIDAPVHRTLLEPLLRARLAEKTNNVLLVPSPTGRQWLRRNFSRKWDAARCKAKLPDLQRRDLRRTAVVLMSEAGLADGQITAITGHRIETTVSILNVYRPRNAAVALSGMEAWERAPVSSLSNVVTLAAERGRRRR
jgi:integrase